MSPAIEGNFEAIGREAYERYLLDLMRESAKEEERLRLENRGERRNPEIREIQLTGEYPHTGFRFRTYDRVRDLEQTTTYPLYDNPQFFDENGKRLCSADRIAGDTLMWVRGG